MKILEHISENVKGIILMIAGFALLLNTLGILVDILWYVLIAISIYLIFVGFVKVKGFELIKSMLTKKEKSAPDFGPDRDEDK